MGKPMTKHIANILTSCRILGSIFLLFLPVFSLAFCITYILCGFSDMIDGAVARKTNSAGKFGSQLDTAADFVFIAASMVRLLPAVRLPLWLWVWGGMIAVIKFGSILRFYIFRKQFLSLHTILNKATGLLLFLLPLTMPFVELKYSAAALCCLATVSAVREGFYVISAGKTDSTNPRFYAE